MGQNSTTKRRFWKRLIAEWEKSGESGRKWALRHGHSYPAFLYWKRRFHPSLKANDFIELSDKKTSSLQLSYQEVQILVEENFSPETLTRLLMVIKSALC
jgi:hypothetical protein